MFSESHARYIISVKKQNIDKIIKKINAPYAIIGEVKGRNLIIDNLVDIEVEKLHEAYEGVIEKFMA
jgi:phosphoribosylformylglycinamidine synthase